MRERLIAAKLWEREDPTDPAASISAAWKVLARLGAACRYSGLSQDGQREYLLFEPASGKLLATGRGRSTPEALCLAALAARAGKQARAA
jgi:hypothetical protein